MFFFLFKFAQACKFYASAYKSSPETFRDYAKQCIDVANKIKELESKGYKEDVMKAYDSALKDADDYSYEVIKEQINNEGFSKDLLLPLFLQQVFYIRLCSYCLL